MPDFKSSAKQSHDSSAKWKSQYKALLGERDQLALSSKKLLVELAELARKLGHVIDTHDRSLSAALQSLVQAVRKDSTASHLDIKLSALAQKIIQVEAGRQHAGLQILDATQRLIEQLIESLADKQQQKRLLQLNKKIAKFRRQKTVITQTNILNWLEQLSYLQQNPTKQARQADKKEKISLLYKLLKIIKVLFNAGVDVNVGQVIERPVEKKGVTEAETQPVKVIDSIVENELDIDADLSPTSMFEGDILVDAHLSELSHGDADSNHGNPYLNADVTAILLELLANIEVPEPCAEKADTLYDDLQHGLGATELVPALENTADIVLAALRRDQSEFESFLALLDENLFTFHQFFSHYDVHHDEMIGIVSKFDFQLTTQIDDMRKNVADNNNVTVMKEKVTYSLDAISALITGFNQQQSSKMAELESQVRDMSVHIKGLEEAAKQAKQLLQVQREKILCDALTQLPNREAYDLRLDEEYKRWKRYKNPLAFAIADIDLFKNINDNYGHAAGDKVLSIIAKLLRQTFRESDFVARYGGEEFAIIFPESNMRDLDVVLEKVLKTIEQCPFRFKSDPIIITLSIGVTQFLEGDTAAKVFARADKALYQAKDAGRNCVRYIEA